MIEFYLDSQSGVAPYLQIVPQVKGTLQLVGPRADPAAVASVHNVVEESHTERQTTLLVRVNGHLFDRA